MLTFDIAGAQIDGARDYQEDAFLTTHLGDTNDGGGSLIIVADGMGGHAAGNVASNMAVQTFNKHVTSNFPSEEMPSVLQQAVTKANDSISETVRETAALKGMGCTLVGVVLEDQYLRWVSVGDSHLYLIRDGGIVKKNADHSYGGFLDRMATEGKPIEPEAGFSRNMLMSALTGDDIAEIDCPQTPLELQAGDRVIVSSDGLDTLSHGKILAFSKESATAKDCVDALLKGVEEAKMPRQDNTTVVVIDVSKKPDATVVPEPAPAEAHTSTAVTIPRDQVSEPTLLPVEDDEAKKGGIGLLVGLFVLIVLIGGGAGYWYVNAGRPAPPPEPEDLVNDTELVEPSGVPDEPVVSVEPEPVAEPEPDAQPQISVPAGTGETFRDALKSGGQGPLMVRVPAGTFMMGEPATTAAFEERPQHKVTIATFAISVHEITIAQYNRFARATGRPVPKTGDLDETTYPVFYVSWNDALDYAKWLSAQTGKKYSLPTEAQWEYAARAGTTLPYWWGRDITSGKAHCFACDTGLDPRRPTKVGRFGANPFGIHDTAGNVQEWVYDCYHDNYDGAPHDGSVFEGGDCETRVVRGGAYASGPKSLRSSARDKFQYDRGNDQIGIRVVRDQ